MAGGLPEDLTERRLRDLMQRSVDDVEPDPFALPRLRWEIPRRRARQRHVRTGAVVALTVLAALPALHGAEVLDLSTGPTASRTDANTVGGTTIASGQGTGRPTSASRLPGTGDGATGVPAGNPSVPGNPGPSADPAAGQSDTPVPPCDHGVLMVTDSHVDPADATGSQYGWFAARNIAGQACRLSDAGAMTISATTGLDPATVQVVAHTVGDAASALPAPVASTQALVLPAGALYRVRFGLVPGRGCPGGSAGPSGAPGPSAPAAGAGGPGRPAAVGASGVPNDGSSPSATPPASPSASPTGSTGTPSGDPSITLSYAPPQVGNPSTLVLKAGCGATVYRAAPEAVPAVSPAASPS